MARDQAPLGFAREKRLLLGLLAFLTPLPLPLNEVTGWAQLALFWIATGLFLLRAWRGEESWLPYWAMNVLAILYLPILMLDLSVLWRGRILQPLVHLVMFALAVKLWGLHREREKWHAFLAIFFLFVAAMGTSVHPSVIVYFVVHLLLTLWTMARFAAAHLLARHGYGGASTAVVPLKGFVLPGTVCSLVLAVPLFATLPRFQNPYIAVSGSSVGAGGGPGRTWGRLDLDAMSRARSDRSVVMRLDYESSPPPGHEARFKAEVYDRFESNAWQRKKGGFERLPRAPGGTFNLMSTVPRSWLEIWLQPQGRAVLVLPVDAAAVDLQTTLVAVQPSGLVSLPVTPPGTVNFRVGLAAGPRLPELAATGATELELDPGGITPRISELAAQVMGDGGATERAVRATRHLLEEYDYSLDLLGSPNADPIEEFLFRSRAGHCELFASSLVLMLRSQGIPARIVSGYLGSEYNPLEGYHIVRNSNAHAWVEARLEDGWRILDPTPPSGLPQAAGAGFLGLMSQAWDFVVFRWDRYVLSYGFYDQARAFFRLRNLWAQLRGLFFGKEPRPDVARPERERPPPTSEPAGPAEEAPGLDVPPWLPLALLLVAAVLWWRIRRPEFTATAAYRRLRKHLRGRDSGIGPAIPPLEAARRVAERFPTAATPTRSLVSLYLRESFGSQRLGEDELLEARQHLRAALGGLRRKRVG